MEELMARDALVVDNTILSDVPCSTKAAMRHVLGLTSGTESKELRCWQAVHEALAWWLCGQGVTAALARFEYSYRAWAEAHVPPDDARAYATVSRVLQHWFRQHPPERWPFVVAAKDVERPLSAELMTLPSGQDVLMVALLDALGRVRTGGWWSIDHKTAGWTGDRFQWRQEDSSQFTGQLWLAQQNPDLPPLGGVYINAIHLKRPPSSDYRCATHKTPYKECGMQHLEHMLFPVTRTQHEVETWAVTARRLVRRLLNLRETVREPKDVRALPMEGRFIGMCGFCEFRDWCRQGRPAGAVRTFTEERWNPLEHAARHTVAIAAARPDVENT